MTHIIEREPERKMLRCLYSCKDCGVQRAGVDVPERADGQVVTEWVESVLIMAIAADHNARSPKCRPETFSEVMIPVPEEAKGVGFTVTEN
jgi:hypothetical protein